LRHDFDLSCGAQVTKNEHSKHWSEDLSEFAYHSSVKSATVGATRHEGDEPELLMHPFSRTDTDLDIPNHASLLTLLDLISFGRQPFATLADLARAIQNTLPFELVTLSFF